MTDFSEEELERIAEQMRFEDLLRRCEEAVELLPFNQNVEDALTLATHAASSDVIKLPLGVLLRLARTLGFSTLKYALKRFDSQFVVNWSESGLARNDANQLAKIASINDYLDECFVDLTVDLSEDEGMGRATAQKLAAAQTAKIADHLLGEGNHNWRNRGLSALQKRFKDVASKYEERRTMPLRRMPGTNRVMPPKHSISKLKGTPGGKGKMRNSRV